MTTDLDKLAEQLTPCWQPTVAGCECPPHRYRPEFLKALKAVRRDALEQAAKIAEESDEVCPATVEAIRNLIAAEGEGKK